MEWDDSNHRARHPWKVMFFGTDKGSEGVNWYYVWHFRDQSVQQLINLASKINVVLKLCCN